MKFRNILSIMSLLLLLTWSTPHAKAQKSDANVTYSLIVDASADDVWTVLRQMDDIDKYTATVVTVEWTGAHGVGGERVCHAPDGKGKFVERIVGFDDAARSYSYALVEGVPCKGMVNNFKVVDLGYKKSMVVWTSGWEQFMDNPQMTEEQFLGFLNQSVAEMVGNIVRAAKKV